MSAVEKTYPNALRFDLTAEQLSAIPEKIIAESKARMDKLASSVDTPTWEATIQPLLDDDALFSLQADNCTFYSHVHEDEKVRDASTEAEKLIQKYRIENSQRYDIYLAVKAYVEKQAPHDKLNEEQQNVLKMLMRDFKLEGLTLDEQKRARAKEIKNELSEMSITFSRNVAEDKTKLEFTREELDGVSDNVLKQLKKTEDGSKYIVTMKYPELIPVLEKAHNPAVRKALAVANASRCMEANIPLMERTVQLRQELANLLGFETPADHLLANKMALTPKAVINFLTDLSNKLEAGLDQDIKTCIEVNDEAAKAHGFEPTGKLEAWDRAYALQLVLARDYQIDSEKISEFFPLEHVVPATLEIYQELFGVRFEKTPNPHVWHPDVTQYSVFDADSNDFIGHFYLDLHPRDGKFTHAAEFGLSKNGIVGGKRIHPIAAMVANFTKPTSDSPSLLRHHEVTTWAHELGHVLHELLSTTTYTPWSGTNTARDFVEAPSQALENWCYEREALLRLSKHYKTGQPLTDDLIVALGKSRNANIAMQTRRQIFFGTFDMTLHSLTPKDPKPNTQQLWNDLTAKVNKIAPIPGSNPAATFAHIMSGYQACYYGYLWSEVFAADIFRQFKKNGIFNGQLGRTYRNKVLARGGSRPEMQSLVDFLGREPTNDAYLEQIGLKSH